MSVLRDWLFYIVYGRSWSFIFQQLVSNSFLGFLGSLPEWAVYSRFPFQMLGNGEGSSESGDHEAAQTRKGKPSASAASGEPRWTWNVRIFFASNCAGNLGLIVKFHNATFSFGLELFFPYIFMPCPLNGLIYPGVLLCLYPIWFWRIGNIPDFSFFIFLEHWWKCQRKMKFLSFSLMIFPNRL